METALLDPAHPPHFKGRVAIRPVGDGVSGAASGRREGRGREIGRIAPGVPGWTGRLGRKDGSFMHFGGQDGRFGRGGNRVAEGNGGGCRGTGLLGGFVEGGYAGETDQTSVHVEKLADIGGDFVCRKGRRRGVGGHWHR